MLKKSSLLFIAFFFSFTLFCKADEGMWLPILLKQLNETDMQSKGLKLSAEDIYSVNKSSLKDAVVHFGGGCTGEIISSEGLLLTNHHCGYGQIQSHSSVKDDYLTNGFWAMDRSEELTNPGLTATFIIRMEDVTKEVLKGVASGMSEALRDSVIAENIKKLEKESVEDTHYEAKIKPFYYGNEFYMFITETFKDVRMVGAPPSSIGKFGGDTDNWMWPRHTGDFSLFRIYAGKDNKPAEYSAENVPFKPRYSFPISLKGPEKGDFTMIFGFPGRTTEYLTSYAVEMITKVSNPAKIKIRDTRLAIWDADMKGNDEVRIKYAAKYASVSNYHKKWIGENRGLKKLDAIEKKKKFEALFLERIAKDPEKLAQYGNLLDDFKKLYEKMDQPQRSYDYFVETAMAVEIVRYAQSYLALIKLSSTPDFDKKELEKALATLKAYSKKHFKDYNAATDKKIFASLLKMYYDDIDKSSHPEIFKLVEKKYKGDFAAYADDLFKKSFMVSEEKVNELLNNYSSKTSKKIVKDPAYGLMVSIYNNYILNIMPQYVSLNEQVNFLTRTYMKALREVVTEKKYYPDANSTLRIAYGKVEGYEPLNAVRYLHYSTLNGIMEKEDPTSEEFTVPAKLKELFEAKDFGPYAHHNGEMRVAFIASNHTTGGNSGSPVIDGNGNLIGTNFDRNWEGTMSDIMYDPDRVRNISVDIRYTLFIIDKFAGAGHLVEEMKLVK